MVHIGVIGNISSGMAQVVNEYMSWSIPSVSQATITTTRGRRDPLSPVLLIRAFALLTIRRVLHRVDTVAVHLSERGSFVREGAIVVLAHALGLRVVAHLHGATFETFAAQEPRLVSSVLRRADAIATLTAQTKQIATRLAPTTPVTLVPNAVKVPPGGTAVRTNTFLFAGEIGERKGVDTLLSAWRTLGSARGEWELHIAGPDKTRLIETAGPDTHAP